MKQLPNKMCGIVYIERSEKSAADSVIKHYTKQKHRGSQGFGYVSVKDGVLEAFERTQDEDEIKKALGKTSGTTILFHHRLPTSTPNLPETNHPIRIKHKTFAHEYYVVHNGIVHNDDELRTKHQKLGYKYTTGVMTKYVTSTGEEYSEAMQYNDSEAFAWEIARYLEHKQKDIKAIGSIAFIALRFTNGEADMLYYGKNNGNPLCVTDEKRFFAICSEGGAPIEANTLYYRNLKSKETTTRELKIGKERKQASLGYTGYSNYDFGDSIYSSTRYNSTGSTGYVDYDEYMELVAEKELKKQLLEKAKGDEAMERMIQDEIDELEAEIATYKYP